MSLVVATIGRPSLEVLLEGLAVDPALAGVAVVIDEAPDLQGWAGATLTVPSLRRRWCACGWCAGGGAPAWARR